MANETQTKLVVFFIFLTLALSLFGYLFRGYIPNLTSSILEIPSSANVTALNYVGALIKIITFQVSSDLYILSLITDAYAFLGMFLVTSFVLNR